MKIPKISYIEFLLLPEDERNELQEAMMYINTFDIDCQSWTWGKVKDAQDIISSELTFKDIFDLARLESELIDEQTDCHIIFGLFNSIMKSIKEISDIEGKEWAHQSTTKEEQAAQAVGGFERFGTMPQTLRLCEILKLNYNDVRKMDWETCFAAFSYDVALGEFKSKLYKQ